MNDYFSVFALTPAFEVDLTDLQKRYFVVQREYHPDMLTGKPPVERQQAILHSMRANEAFEALKNPLLRARHLLALQNIHVGSERDSVKPSPELLMEIMELREALDEIQSPDKLQAFSEANSKRIEVQISILSGSFGAKDWEQAAHQTLRLGYLIKIGEEIRLKGKAV